MYVYMHAGLDLRRTKRNLKTRLTFSNKLAVIRIFILNKKEMYYVPILLFIIDEDQKRSSLEKF